MEIKIKYFASLREKAQKSEEVIQLEKNKKLSDIYEELTNTYHFNYAPYEIKFAVNNTYVSDEYELQNNDVLAFIPPVAGG